MTSSGDRLPFGKWHWQSSESPLDLHSARPGAKAYRVTYRARGGGPERSFLLYTDPEQPFTPELVLRGIEERERV